MDWTERHSETFVPYLFHQIRSDSFHYYAFAFADMLFCFFSFSLPIFLIQWLDDILFDDKLPKEWIAGEEEWMLQRSMLLILNEWRSPQSEFVQRNKIVKACFQVLWKGFGWSVASVGRYQQDKIQIYAGERHCWFCVYSEKTCWKI